MTARNVPGPPHRLTIEAEVGGPPDEVFDHFVRPDLLARWWPPEAEVEPRVGGEYRLAWPAQGWTLRGLYTRVDRPARLGFTGSGTTSLIYPRDRSPSPSNRPTTAAG